MSKSRRQHEQLDAGLKGAWPWLALGVLATAVWLVYGRSLDAPFIFDDLLSVQDNASISQLWPLVGDAQHPGPLNPPVELPTSARPLVNLSFAVNYHFGGLDPRGYRAVNIALHILSAWLLWAIVGRTLKLPYLGGRFERASGLLALAVALLWAVHPLVTEAVIYVTQRTELMVGFFYLATLFASLHYWCAEKVPARRLWLVLATLACFAGAASKEIMVSAPLIVLLYERTFVSGTLRECRRNSWPLYLGLTASWLLILALQWNSPRSRSAGFGLAVPLIKWWCTQAQVFWMYLKLALYPWPLVIHYELPVQSFATNWMYIAATTALAILTLVLLWRRHAAGFLLACVFLILAPTHLVPIPSEMAAERRMYLPLAALVTLVVVGEYALVARILSNSPQDRSQPASRRPLMVAVAIALVLALAYGVASAQRFAVYREPVTLWQDAVAMQSSNPVAEQNLAAALAATGRWKEAIGHYREALRFKADNPRSQYGLGLALTQVDQLDEAIEHLRAVVRLKPDAYKIRNNLGVVLFTAGRFPEAIAEFEKTLALKPDFVEAQENLNRARRGGVLPKNAQ